MKQTLSTNCRPQVQAAKGIMRQSIFLRTAFISDCLVSFRICRKAQSLEKCIVKRTFGRVHGSHAVNHRVLVFTGVVIVVLNTACLLTYLSVDCVCIGVSSGSSHGDKFARTMR